MKNKCDEVVNAIGRLATWLSLIAMMWLLLLGVLQSSILYWVFFVFFFLSSLVAPETKEKQWPR